MRIPLDLTGQRYGRWLVIGPRQYDRRSGTLWPCRCDCGTARVVSLRNLRSGGTVSCGCYHREVTARVAYRHGATAGGRHLPEYDAWTRIHNRCRNPNVERYPRYGGRGIRVCERWDDFAHFLADMGPRPSPEHSIDRIDNDGPYAPENCRWATSEEQRNNTSRTRYLAHDGVTRSLAEWSMLVGIDPRVIRQRIDRRGWSIERALTEPVPTRYRC